MKQPKATHMFKVAVLFLAMNLIATLFLVITNNKEFLLPFLIGDALWIANLFIWSKNVEDGT